MTRLVVHVGTHATGWSALQRQLVSWRGPLDAVGVRLHPSDDPAVWASDATQLAEDAAPESVVEAADAAVRDSAEILLLSAERFEDSLRDPAGFAALQAFARDAGLPLTVVSIVRDQVGYLNELYCDRVTHLQMARSFASFAADPQPEGRFDYESAFGLVLGATDAELVVVPHSASVDDGSGRAVLRAAGLAEAEFAALPGSTEPAREAGLPGPVAVAATRLLYKRMWRMGMFNSLPRPRLLAAAAALRLHAVETSWDDGVFWGWSDPMRHEAIARFQPGNDRFAHAVWGREWGDDWETGRYVDVDVAASAPNLVVDMLQTVDKLIKELQQAKALVGADAADE